MHVIQAVIDNCDESVPCTNLTITIQFLIAISVIQTTGVTNVHYAIDRLLNTNAFIAIRKKKRKFQPEIAAGVNDPFPDSLLT